MCLNSGECGMMGEQQFCLRWNNHGSTLVAVFDSLLTSESLVDVTLAAEGHLLKAHKVVLSACSPYFQTLFAQHMDKHPIVILKDVKYADMKALLDYMYRGEVNVSQDQLGPLIKTAESLKIKGLADGTNRQESDKGPIPKPSQSVPRSLPNDNVSDVKPRPPPPDSFPSVASSVSSVLSSALTMPSSVLSNALTMPSPLSLQSPLSLPPMGSVSEHESTGPPHPKRLKKMRRRSGEPDSGDSDGPASSPNESSGGTSMHLPKIPATITPIPGQQPLPSVGPAPDLRPLSGEESHPADKESPLALRTSVCGSSSSDKESSSPSKIVKLEGSENSRDTNHLSDDEHDEKSSSHGGNDDHSTDNFAQPSTSRPLDESNQHSSGFLGWPYAGTDGSGMEEPSYGSLTENSSQDYFRAFNLVRGFPSLLPPRMSTDILHRPPPIGLPLYIKSKEKSSPKSMLGYPFSESPKQFACDKCGRTYASTGNLKRHKKYECGVEPQFSCPICKKKFQHRHSVKIHVFSTHRNEAGEGGQVEGKEGPIFPSNDPVASVGVCKDEYFPLPQEASASSTQNQDS
ncbi:uncharacterized protein LOC143036811 isoform X4 [Oratosquilla oratoria]|uniref:uncharacterized protein LOC143036811 isoform X4 n=1 Tax=Oratosquilla oratoria TaxID=337810 RepID=UPI003F765D2A